MCTWLQTRTQEVARLKEKVTEAEENIATTDDMARALLAEREAAQGEAQGAHARAEDAEAELEVVRQRLTEANDALAQHDAELHARNADVDARDREIRNLRRERDGLETQVRVSYCCPGLSCNWFCPDPYALLNGVKLVMLDGFGRRC